MEKINNFIPKITVITPTYNRADLIIETIESVIAQDYKNFEYLILDDGSTDDTEEIVKPYLKDKRIKYLKHENEGEAETVNWGWSLAKGEYFTQVNSDDPILPGLFSEMVNVLDEKPEVVVAYPDFYFIDENGKIIKQDKTPDWNFIDALSSYSCYAASAGTFIRKTAFSDWKKIKNSKFRHISDVEMYWKMALVGDFVHVPKFLATWRVHSGSISADRYKCIPEVLEWFEDYFTQKNLPKNVMNSKGKVQESVYNYSISLLQQSEIENKNELIAEFNNKFFKSNILQIGDNDLIGNKFNGHDLHFYLNERGLKSKHLVWNKESNDADTFKIARFEIDRNEIKSNSILMQKKYSIDGTLNPLWFNVLLDPLFLNSDLIHFHLIHNGLVDVQLLPLMSKIKPIIWTIHDPWAFSGHCIEHVDCDKWKKSCCDCPHLKLPFEIDNDNSALNFELKKEAIQNSQIEMVVASKFMFDKVKESPIFKNKNIHLIPFGINQDIFKKLDKVAVRKKLNIPVNALVISFRSDTRYKKGVDFVEHVIKNLKTSREVYFISFGGGNYYKNDDFNYIEYGWVKDDLLMSDIYNASDLFLMPSTLESFGMMAIEAMSCATMPIVLDGTALPDTVNAPECGVSTKKDKDEYLKAVQYYIDNENEREERAEKSLEFAKKNYNKDVYINKIIKIYEQATARHILTDDNAILLNQLKKYTKVETMTSNTVVPQNNNINELDFLPRKEKIRSLMRKLLFTISPTFRMLSGNRHRMNILLEKIENLERSNEQKLHLILENAENAGRSNEQKLNFLMEKVENFETSLNGIRRDYLPKPYNQNINLMGEVINVSEKNNSKIRKYKCSNEEFFEKIKEYILKTDVVLDIGCGIRPQTFFTPKVHICIEPFDQYREIVKPLFPNRSHFIFLKEDALKAIQGMDDNSVDSVFMIDLIEHLDKKNGLSLLKEADRVARKQIIVFTPFGFYPMCYKEEGMKDAWGLNGTDVQEHKSGWMPEDFDESWDFHVCENCHEAFLPEEKAQGKRYSALMAIKTKNFNGFQVMEETPVFVKNVYKERIIEGNFNI